MSKKNKSKLSQNVIKLIKKDPIHFAQNVEIEELETILIQLSDSYYNDENRSTNIVSDKIFDKLKDILKKRDPKNNFLKLVGAPIKGTKEKVKLPYEMSSLLKLDEKELIRWINKYGENIIVSDKLDGVSAQLYKNTKGEIFMFSRGDGIEGQNISHLISFMFSDDLLNNLPNELSVRGELIISKNDFNKISSYMKNARNAVAGLVNSKTVDKNVANITQFIAYSIMNPRLKQSEQMTLLKKYNFDTVEYKILKSFDYDKLSDYLIKRRLESEFEMDGLVCVDNSKVYKNVSGYPDHAFAFKILLDDQIAISTVKQVLWMPSMNEYLKPKIEIKPVELLGTTITYATAHNAKFIVDNKLGKGAKVKIVRSGDVIPYIYEVIKPAKEIQMPDYPYKWNSTKVDLILKKLDGDGKRIVIIKLIVHFFKTIGVKYLSEGLITKFVDMGYDTIEKIINADHNDLLNIEGFGDKMINKIYDEIDTSLKEMSLSTFMTASHKFGRGFGIKKIKEVINTYPNILNEKWTEETMINKLLEVPGFSDISAQTFSKKYPDFIVFYEQMNKIIDLSRFKKNIKKKTKNDKSDNKLFTNQHIVFTGFRDKELENIIENNGGKITTSVSKNTSLLIYSDNVDIKNSKFKKAQELKINMISKSDFINKYKR